MLNILKFVSGSVSKRDFNPVLTHFHINNGRIQGYNGVISLSSPIDLGIVCLPKAVAFTRAIQACEDKIDIKLTPTGRLSIKSGKFKSLVECSTGEYPTIEPDGQTVALKGSILEALKVLEPFIAEDSSRPWARGILFKGGSAFATNNIILVEYWIGHEMPLAINIPHAAVSELIRIDEEPISLQVNTNSATFHFEGGRWLKTQLYTVEWANVGKILEVTCNPTPVHSNVYETVEKLKPFIGQLNRIYLKPGTVGTENIDTIGTHIECPEVLWEGAFDIRQFLLLSKVAETIDLTTYPKPSPFFGKNLRGAIIGMKV